MAGRIQSSTHHSSRAQPRARDRRARAARRANPIPAPPAYLTEEKRVVLEDRVQLPRLYMCWLSAPIYSPGDAELERNPRARSATLRVGERLQ